MANVNASVNDNNNRDNRDNRDNRGKLRISPAIVKQNTVTISELADAVGVRGEVIEALADAGYLCAIPIEGPSGVYNRIAKGQPGKHPPTMIRVIDRASILLWLLDLDRGARVPEFNKYIEVELIRISRLPDPQRTEQSLRLLLRYRDAEVIMQSVARIRAGDMATVLIQQQSKKHKRKLEKLMGLPKGSLVES